MHNLHLNLPADLREQLERAAQDRRAGFAATTVEAIRAGLPSLTPTGQVYRGAR